MASTLNLKRNSRVFFTTVGGTSGLVGTTAALSATNTQEITVLDGFSFSQNTTAQTITVNEAGATPTRGQRSFNTALNPVDFSFSTYIKPQTGTGKCDEYVLWAALFGDKDPQAAAVTNVATFSGATGITPTYSTSTGVLSVTGTGMPVVAAGTYIFKGWTGVGANQFNTAVVLNTASTSSTLVATYIAAPTVAAPTLPATASFSQSAWNNNAAATGDTQIGATIAYGEVTPARSNVNQLLPFGMIIQADGVIYTIDNCVMDQASIDFGLDGIATIAWTGKGTQLNVVPTNSTISTAANPVFTGGNITGTATGRASSASSKFITNKLSTAYINSNLGGDGVTGSTAYTLALTGGSIQIANNATYLTPANLGMVNVPFGYYIGTRSITGSLQAYLRTGTAGSPNYNTGDLLAKVLVDSTTNGVTETKYKLGINIGGGSNATRVEAIINGASLQVPTIDAGQDIISTTINFTAQGTDNVTGSPTAAFDLTQPNDLRIRYFA